MSNQIHQQQGVMTLSDFAALHGLTMRRASYLATRGRILGATRHVLSKRWLVYPPAKLLMPDYGNHVKQGGGRS